MLASTILYHPQHVLDAPREMSLLFLESVPSVSSVERYSKWHFLGYLHSTYVHEAELERPSQRTGETVTATYQLQLFRKCKLDSHSATCEIVPLSLLLVVLYIIVARKVVFHPQSLVEPYT